MFLSVFCLKYGFKFIAVVPGEDDVSLGVND